MRGFCVLGQVVMGERVPDMSREARMIGTMPVEPSGHVFRVERKRGPQWYAKYRLPDGRQVQRRIGPAWTGRGRPPAGYFTKRGPRPGCATCSTRRAAARCRARSGPA